MAPKWTERWCYASRVASGAVLRDLLGQSNFAAENFYTISTDAHIDYLVIFLRRAHKYAARAMNFQSLFDHYALIEPMR